MKKYLLVLLMLAWANQILADDTDLYVDNTVTSEDRPSVLIILDNSGSMGNVNTNNSKANQAREIIIDLINDNSDIDFALQIFNANNQNNGNDDQGGRIIYGFNDLSIASNKSALISLLDSDTDNTNLNYERLQGQYTPLCETLYETYRYLSGGQVFYGAEPVPSNRPASIKTSGNYTSPFTGITCDKEITIIYITDGAAVRDSHANSRVRTLTGASSTDAYDSSYLGVLGDWMSKRNWLTMQALNDTNESTVVGTVKIHTVGFGSITSNTTAVNLLKLAARDGELAVPRAGYHGIPSGGEYHEATTAEDLKDQLADAILTVRGNSTLTAASVSANSFDPTQTLDSVYYAMFEPSTGSRWQGNLKKYKIVNGEQVDALGNAVIDATGEFDDSSRSFWSDVVDGSEVAEGGVAEMLREKAVSDRKYLTDIDGNVTLTEEFNESDLTTEYSEGELKTLFDVTDVADIPDLISWAKGVDVDDYDEDVTTTIRPDVFADPLHSKPIVINYDGGNSRIVVGTNAGVLHMFEDVSDTEVKENWAYLPKDFFKNIKGLRENIVAADNKIYGLDGEMTLYINDDDGTINPADGDFVWLFYGVRRGGKSYYGLDLTLRDSPKLMWHIENTGDFDKLGYTFSKPKVVRSPYNTTDADNLVVVFGGGYDETKDNDGPNSSVDTLGTAIYMVNARNGNHILTKDTAGGNGIASSVATMDSDSDGFVDRLYVGDTGGSVWRLDMPDTDKSNNSLIELASFGGTTNDTDRRFFNEPTIVRTYILETYNTGTTTTPNIVQQEVPYDAVLLGSGDRASPLNGETSDMFFMIKDINIKTAILPSSTPTITYSDLYDYTDNPFENYPDLTATQEGYQIDASLTSGWHVDFEETGEKSTARALVLNNVVYFTSYTPSSTTACDIVPGDAWLYAIDLALGIKKYNWSTDTDNREDRIKQIGHQFVGAPTLISTPVTTTDADGNTETNIEGSIIVNKEVIPDGFGLQTMRTSLTIPEG